MIYSEPEFFWWLAQVWGEKMSATFLLYALCVVCLTAAFLLMFWELCPGWSRSVRGFFFSSKSNIHEPDPGYPPCPCDACVIERTPTYKERVIERQAEDWRKELDAYEEIQMLEDLYALDKPHPEDYKG